MTDQPIPVAVYGCKSSPDEKEAVADQHRIIRAAIEKEGGREIVGTFGEENQSGYRKERGPQLEQAMSAAVSAAEQHGEAELWVWHSSRLARGDGRKGRRSINLIVAQLLYANVTVRSATDPEMVTPMLAGIASTVSNKYSEDLSGWIKRGVARRQAKGLALGAVPFGHVIQRHIDADQRVVSERVPDPTIAAIVLEMFTLADNGASPGEIGRLLNERGIANARGGLWGRENVARLLRNRAYLGEKGYQQIVPSDLWERVNAQLNRADPAAVQRRQGGRPPKQDSLLKGIAFCGDCRAPRYVGANTKGVRFYICRTRGRGTGQCTARAIPAEQVEMHVMNHLRSFVGTVEDWLRQQASERDRGALTREAQLDRERAELAEIDRKRSLVFADYERMVADGDPLARYALESLAGIDQRRDRQQQQIEAAQAVLAEWTGPADTDAALDYYGRILDVIQGKVSQAQGVRELNAALASVIAGLWMRIETDDAVITHPTYVFSDGELRRRAPRGPVRCERLIVEFALHGMEQPPASLPPIPLGAYTPAEPPGKPPTKPSRRRCTRPRSRGIRR
jgi:DNA invertase Pin-like site-specific DNA recombinase